MTTLLQQRKIMDCPVHSFCTSQGINILKNDHPTLFKNHLDKYLPILDKGNSWCDEGFNNIHHFYHPKTGRGIMGLTGADVHLTMNIEKAQKAFRNSAFDDCFFYIGCALHLIQDLCVPHHALGHLLKGHREYEDWVLENYISFSVVDEGIYDFNTPIEILQHNAQIAIQYSELVFNANSKNKIEATRELLGLAQRTSASFLSLIFKKIIPLDIPF
jgi:phospholipase C